MAINSVPWAKVYVDGRLRGETPVEGLRLRPGKHRVKLVSPVRGLTRSYILRVRPGARLRRVYHLDAGKGTSGR